MVNMAIHNTAWKAMVSKQSTEVATIRILALESYAGLVLLDREMQSET